MAALPSYVAEAKPVPLANRAPWYATTAQTYAGIMLWFVFWHEVPIGSGFKQVYSEFAGGTLAQGLGVAFLGLIVAALVCHFLFYLVPGLLGMKTGLPLYIVGTSTYGVQGGFIMPGFLMGLLQFGWLGVSAFFSSLLLCAPLGYGPLTWPHAIVAALWAIAAAFVGLKGIRYVAGVATFLPLIPLVILVILAVNTIGGVGSFDAAKLVASYTGEKFLEVKPALSSFGVVALITTYVVGFFATAGAAGVDIASSNRNARDVQLGGLVGVAGSTIFAGGLSLLIVAGAHGLGLTGSDPVLQTSALMSTIMGTNIAAVFWYLLAIAAFPSACFASLIAANCFKTTMPNVNPVVSVSIGTALAIVLAVTGIAGNAVDVFKVIGASFGPICGAMAADYLLAGRKWAGPRAGFNPAGWISWAAGFMVGAIDLVAKYVPQLGVLAGKVPAPPLVAFIVGFVLYILLAKMGLESKSLPMPATTQKS